MRKDLNQLNTLNWWPYDQLKEDVKSLKAEAGRVDKLEADMARLKTMLEELMKKNTKPAKK
jgi:hypothetical protein